MFPNDQDITCFTTLYGNYNFKVMRGLLQEIY